MSDCPALPSSEIDQGIRRSGRIGRFLTTTFLVLGAAFSLWLTVAIALTPRTLAKMNLTDQRAAEIEGFRHDPAKFVNLLEAHPDAVVALAKAERESIRFQDLADHRLKRAGAVCLVVFAAALGLTFLWLLRRLFTAFAEGEVLTPQNARTLKLLGVIIVVVGIITLHPGVALAGLLDIALAWSLRQALLLKAEQALVI
jgi:uncharacterized protein YjeT (DUF2065 family)